MYDKIIDKITPTQEEFNKMNHIIQQIQWAFQPQLDLMVCGSVAKGTALRGTSDIDIFIFFDQDTPEEKLKELGLKYGHIITKRLGGKSTEKYASHPYVTAEIDGFMVDFVPCYKIKDATELKSAVDRTPLHTKYVKEHLNNPEQVLLLKQFMRSIGVYGANTKVNGFSGYLCEILIMKYGSFEEVLKESQNWFFEISIDLEDWDTEVNFYGMNYALIVIDPVDGHRNVAAALSRQKMAEFQLAAFNYLRSDNKELFFQLVPYYSPKEFKKAKDNIIVFKAPLPKISEDAIHSQIQSALNSLNSLFNTYRYNAQIYSYDIQKHTYEIAIMFETMQQNKLQTKIGPYFHYNRVRGFIDKYGPESIKVDKNGRLYTIQDNPAPTINKLIDGLLNGEYNDLIISNDIIDSLTKYGFTIETEPDLTSVIKLLRPSKTYRQNINTTINK